MRLGAGPPVEQLALGEAVDMDSADRWAVHSEVVRRALEQHREEVGWVAGPPVELKWVPPPVDDD